MFSDLLQNICFPMEMLLGSTDGVDHIVPVDAGSTAPVSILTALQPLWPEAGVAAAAAAAGEQEADDDDDAKKRRRGGERGARWSAAAAASGLLQSISAGWERLK